MAPTDLGLCNNVYWSSLLYFERITVSRSSPSRNLRFLENVALMLVGRQCLRYLKGLALCNPWANSTQRRSKRQVYSSTRQSNVHAVKSRWILLDSKVAAFIKWLHRFGYRDIGLYNMDEELLGLAMYECRSRNLPYDGKRRGRNEDLKPPLLNHQQTELSASRHKV
jgi:hypothetical protein